MKNNNNNKTNNNNNNKNNNNKQNTNKPKNTQVKKNKKIVTTTIKNQFLSKLFSPTTSIKEIIENLDEINKLSSEEIHTELLKFDLYQLLMVKANLEKADKVNFLIDEIKWCKLIVNKDIKNTIIPMLSIFLSLFALTFNKAWEVIIGEETNTKFSIALAGLIIFLVFLLVYFVHLEDKYTSKKTDNKYKVFQYLVDIAIENKKKELN